MTVRLDHEPAIGYYVTPYGQEAYCLICNKDLWWQECDQCDEGFSHHGGG